MGKSLKPLLDGTVEVIHPADEAISGELFNNTSVRMGEWKGVRQSYDKPGVWKLYNLANDLGENTNIADQHPDIVQTMKAAYDKYAQEVGVVIPTSGPFFNAISTNNCKQYTNY
jgi:arylsulfatase A-like enzyme